MNAFAEIARIILKRDVQVNQVVENIAMTHFVHLDTEITAEQRSELHEKLTASIRFRPLYKALEELLRSKWSEEAAEALAKVYREFPELYDAALGQEVLTMLIVEGEKANGANTRRIMKEVVPELCEIMRTESGDEWKQGGGGQ